MLAQLHAGRGTRPASRPDVAGLGSWRTLVNPTRYAHGGPQIVSAGGRWVAPALRANTGDNAPTLPSPESSAEVVADVSEQAAQAEPWSPEFIRGIVRRQAEEEEALLSEQLSWPVKADPEGMYEYVSRAYEEGGHHVTTPAAALLEDATGVPTIGYPAAVANDIVGIGSWRLKDYLDPVIEFMVARIEGSWRELLDTDLNLYPKDKWKALGWDLADSEDPKRELDGFSYADIPDPEPGTEGYPRLLLENRVYCSKVFRKLHLEVGLRQDGLQVLHVVVYPRYRYDLPIFGLDVVMVDGRVTLAVADCCPVRKDLKLPQHYMETMALLQKTFMEGLDPTSRRIPDWGAASFSPLAVCITPSGPEELAAFAKYAVALHRAHLTMSLNAVPLVPAPGDWRQAERLQELLAGQKRFCDNQLANKKTRRVLEAAFGKDWTDEYMTKLMFDIDPTYDPPYYDVSYERLYTYFDENPEFGDLANEGLAMEMEAEGERAAEALQAAADGQPVSQEKLAMAVKFLYENDPTFRIAIQSVAGDQQQVTTDDALTNEVLKLLQTPEEALGSLR